MGVSAKTLLSRHLPDGVSVTMETTHLKNQEAYGNGSGIMWVSGDYQILHLIGWLPRRPLNAYLGVLVMAVKMSQLKRPGKKQQMR